MSGVRWICYEGLVPLDPDRQGTALGSPHGFRTGGALSSAVLLAAAPQCRHVYDGRTDEGLKRLDLKLKSGRGSYARYMKFVEQLRDQALINSNSWTGRHLDVSLYQPGRGR